MCNARRLQPSVEPRQSQRLSLLVAPTADQPVWRWHQATLPRRTLLVDAIVADLQLTDFPSLPVVSPTDGPRAEGGHKPHLWSATDQDQAAGHLL